MSTEKNSTLNKKPKRRFPKISTIIRWIFGVLFVLFIFITGLHYSSLFLIGASFFMIPLPFVASFWKRHNVNTMLVIALSILLFLSGLISSPAISNKKYILHENDITTNDEENESDKSTNSESNIMSDTSTSEDDGLFAFISQSGNKYHSKPNCSNMKSPTPITVQDAELQGYEPCKKCN